MNLHDKPEMFEDAIHATAEYFKTNALYIEKDYWVTSCLKKLAQSIHSDQIVFKGGTALSKCYGLINRFSEDIDIAVLCQEGLSGNKIKKLIKDISVIGTAGLETMDKDPRTSKGSKFRKTVHRYPIMGDTEKADFGQASPEILLEVNSFTHPEPYEIKTVQSYLGKFMVDRKPELIERYGLGEFRMNVLSLKRTVAEKIMGLIRAGYGEKSIPELKNKIRHLYDLHYILGDEDTAKFVKSDAFFNILDTVIACDQESLPETPWCMEPLGSSLLFSSFQSIWPELEKTYYKEFSDLVFDTILPNKEDLEETIHIVHKRLSIYDTKT